MPSPDLTAVSDALLLARFVQTCDEQAFRELVERHSRLVFGVCTRVLGHRQDAEEAFQATFLVLTQKAEQLEVAHSRSPSLGPWLYGVAYRVAVRAAQKRTRRKENPLPQEIAVGNDMLEHLTDKHWRAVLDDELNRLPKKYREPLVLHYLLGKKNPEIAAELGLTIRTVEGRQRRGKQRLRQRLALRKVSLPLAVATLAAASEVLEAAPLETLIDATVQASLALASGKPLPADGMDGAALTQGTLSQRALALSRPEVIAMQFPLAPAAVLATVVLVAGAAIGLAKNDAGAGDGKANPLPLTQEVANEQTAANKTVRDFAVQLAGSESSKPLPTTNNKGVTQPAAGPASFLPKVQSAQERLIYKAFAMPLITPLDFVEAPLNEVLATISEDYGISILFDKFALDSLAISEEAEVTIKLRDLPLKSALNLLLTEVEDLTYIVRDDVLWITSNDEANQYLETRIYDVEEFNIDVEDLTDTLIKSIGRNSWEQNGTGDGTISPIKANLIAISQTQAVHADIAAFLTELQQHMEQRSDGQ